MSRFFLGLIGLVFASVSVALAAETPLLLQHPTINDSKIVFVYGGDLWSVSREGGAAERLTAGTGTKSRPFFSPDGREIAFTANFDGNLDVYIIPAAGGVPRRLTHHPAPDIAMGWTRDGKHVLFSSNRASSTPRYNELFTVSQEGGFPSDLPLPMALEGSYSPDGKEIAYVPLNHAFEIWKRYQGGMTSAIWIARLSDSGMTQIPRQNSNDFNPMWIGDQVYFLSDRNGPT